MPAHLLKPLLQSARCIIAAASLLLVACAGSSFNPADSAYQHLPRSHFIEGLPYYPQQSEQCGPASLATMLAARQITVSMDTLRKLIYIPDKHGTLTTELVARARRYGLLVYPLTKDPADIFAEVSAGNPVLVFQNLGLALFPRWHFSVVIGYDLNRHVIILRSGKSLADEVDIRVFMQTWQRADYWAAVMTDPQQLPATASAPRILHAANDLELVGELDAASKAYQALLTRWPDTAPAYFGAGNACYGLGQYPQARDYFSGYIARQPGAAAGWNNLAYTLIKLHCFNEANAAIDCARKLEPDNRLLTNSHAEISAYKQPTPTLNTQCAIPACPTE